MDLTLIFGGLCSDAGSCLQLVATAIGSGQVFLIGALAAVIVTQLAKLIDLPFLRMARGKYAWAFSGLAATALMLFAAATTGQSVTVTGVIGALLSGLLGTGLFSATKNTVEALKAGKAASEAIKTTVDAADVFRGKK